MGFGNIKMQRTSVSMHMHFSIILGVWDEAVKCRIEDDEFYDLILKIYDLQQP